MPTLHLNGFDAYVDVRGDGPPLLLLHGGMGTGADWRYIFPEDPDGYRVVVPDLRGHGRSTNPSRRFTFRQCALDVLAMLDALGVGKASAIGLSMGAKTLLHVASLRPEAIGTMVLVSATPYFPEALRAAASQFTPDALARLDETARTALRVRHVHGDDQIAALYEMTRSFADSYDDMAFTPTELARISARTLIVHGDRDPLYPVELAVELYRGIPNSALWVVPNGGHGPVFGEQAARFRQAALAYLQDA
jgi:pimeloyl-ACP methyl ester carboxylesterase